MDLFSGCCSLSDLITSDAKNRVNLTNQFNTFTILSLQFQIDTIIQFKI
jgi:hypothetical protein